MERIPGRLGLQGFYFMSEYVIELPNGNKMNWPTSLVLVLFHIGAIAALFMFSWRNLLIQWLYTGLLWVGASASDIIGCTRIGPISARCGWSISSPFAGH